MLKDLVSTAAMSQSKSMADKNKSVDELNKKSSESSLGFTRNSNTGNSAKNTK